jgi:hypothetical protein
LGSPLQLLRWRKLTTKTGTITHIIIIITIIIITLTMRTTVTVAKAKTLSPALLQATTAPEITAGSRGVPASW